MSSAFSLTPDPRFYFRSRSHGRVFDALSAAMTRREQLLLVLGDLGVGKTTLCRTLLDAQERKSRAALLGNALLSPEDLLRQMLRDLGAVASDAAGDGALRDAHRAQLVEMFNRFLSALNTAGHGAVMIVDEAHSLPPAAQEQVLEIASLPANRERVLQFLLAGQPAAGGGPAFRVLSDDRLAVRARLLPLERDECGRYITHRLSIAGSNTVTFAARTVEAIYTLSGGVPRLVNLLCERALQEAATAGARRVEPQMIESAARVLDLVRLRPRRFRWRALNPK